MKAKAWQEMRNLTEVELEAKLRDLEDKLFKMKFRHATTPIKNALDIRTMRRSIARLKTLQQENQTRNSQA